MSSMQLSQDIINNERRNLAFKLNGFLDALAMLDDSSLGHFTMSATLIQLGNSSVEQVILQHLVNMKLQPSSFQKGSRWTEVEAFFKEVLLSSPFGKENLTTEDAVKATKRRVAFKAADLVMFLDPNQNPRGIYYLNISNSTTVIAKACAVLYESDVLLISHYRWPIKNPES